MDYKTLIYKNLFKITTVFLKIKMNLLSKARIKSYNFYEFTHGNY